MKKTMFSMCLLLSVSLKTELNKEYNFLPVK